MITKINHDLFKDIQQSEPEEIWYRTFDGKQDPGVHPEAAGFRRVEEVSVDSRDPRRSAFRIRQRLQHEFQWMAAKGYVVLFTNPRGSTSYG